MSSDLPTTDPELLAAQKAMRVRPWIPAGILVVAVAVVGFVIAMGLFGRGALVSTAVLHREGRSAVTFESTGQPLTFWATLDGSWQRRGREGTQTRNDTLPVHYEIDLVQQGQVARHLSIDTQDGRTVDRRYCTVAPDCEVLLEDVAPLPAGVVEMRVEGRPREDVTSVVDMSINVRRTTIW